MVLGRAGMLLEDGQRLCCRGGAWAAAAVLGAPQPSGSAAGAVAWLCRFQRRDSEISGVGLIPEMCEKGGEQQISLGLVPAKFSSGPKVGTRCFAELNGTVFARLPPAGPDFWHTR